MREHGRRVTYMFGPVGNDRRHGCRCDYCRRANADYQRSRSRATRSIDAARVAAHLERLAADGLGNRAVAKRTGINTGVLHRIRTGDTKRVHRSTADKIFGLGQAPEATPLRHQDPLPAPAPFVSVAWQADAACRDVDVEVFFPGRGESIAPAKAVCHGCSVKDACLEYSLEVGLRHGIYGGLSERERRRLRRARRLDEDREDDVA